MAIIVVPLLPIITKTECQLISLFILINLAADVGFVVCGSRKVGKRNFKRLLTFVRSVYQGLPVSWYDTRIGLVVYSTGAKVQFNYRKYKDIVSLDKAMASIQYPGGRGNRVGRALRITERRLLQRSSRLRVPKILVVFVVGRSTDQVRRIARRVQRTAHVIPVGLGRKPDKRLVKTLATKPDRSVSGVRYRQLPSTRQNIVDMIKASKL